MKVFQGDFYVGKGCGSVCIDQPEIGLIDIYTTHVWIEVWNSSFIHQSLLTSTFG